MFDGKLSLRDEYLNDGDDDDSNSDDDVDDKVYQGEAQQPEQPPLHHYRPRERVAR